MTHFLAVLPSAITRLLCASAVIGLTAGAFFAFRALVLARAARAAAGFSLFRRGKPGILYFTARDCATCKAAQLPALQALERHLDGGVQVIEIDALNRPDLAREWSVLSVPTTFVLDKAGRPREVNHGFASTEKLLSQLRRVRWRTLRSGS